MGEDESFGIATAWLDTFGKALADKDIKAFVDHFTPDGWLKDALVFGWDYRSLAGPDKIATYLTEGNALQSSSITNVELDTREGLAPAPFQIPSITPGIELAFTFQAPAVFCRGFARLIPMAPPNGGEWKALTVYLMVDQVKGHEEAVNETGVYEGHTKPWSEVKAERQAATEENPEAIISENLFVPMYFFLTCI